MGIKGAIWPTLCWECH